MLFIFINRILLITILCFSALVNAQQVDNIYQGDVLIGNFDELQLKKRALQQVLIKVSGNSNIVNRDETQLLLKNTQALISQYTYREIQGSQYFSAVFDKNKINQALKDMQQPIWGDTRPTTLIWLINNNEIMSDNLIKQKMDISLSNAIQSAEQQRGIQVQFPLMDLDDNIALSTSDIKGRFYEQVAMASARYEHAHFVLAELQYMGSERWALSWQLVKENVSTQRTQVLLDEQFLGDKLSVTQKMIHALADYYASQYAILENQGEKFSKIIHINGINSLAKLTQLHSMLKKLLAISSYNIATVQGAQVTIEVKLNGGLNSFKHALLIQPHLQRYTENNEQSPSYLSSGAVSEDALYFNWR